MNQSILLGVNIDHIATLRQARGSQYPDPVHAAAIAEEAGADGITLHLREDRRHIQDRDVRLLKETLQVPMNLEMAVTEEMIAIAIETRPRYCCLVPEKREELTTEGGLDVAGQAKVIQSACERLAAANICVSLFIDADKQQIEAAQQCGAPAIELHTGCYADATSSQQQAAELNRISEGVTIAKQLGLTVNAGHGLHYHNVKPIAALNDIRELNIGHSLIARACFTGLAEAVREMKRLMIETQVAA